MTLVCAFHPAASGPVPGCGPLLSPTTCHSMPVSGLPRDPDSCPLFYLMLLGAAWGSLAPDIHPGPAWLTPQN